MAQACQITGTYGPNVEKQWPVLFDVAGLYGLQDRDVLAGMCGIIGHESAGHWWPIHEFGDGTRAYFDRYGRAPNGQDYGGRGLIQTTWLSAYQIAQDYLRDHFGIVVDLVGNPDVVLGDPVIAAHLACIYWVTHAGGILVDMCRAHRWDEVIHYVWGLNAPGNSVFDAYLVQVKRAATYLLAR